MSKITIRRAKKSDSRAFIKLLVALARFEHLDPPDAAGKRRIILDIFDKKRANLLLAFEEGSVVGYAVYFFTYSTFLARPTLYLEDIFVLEKFRRQGVGSALFMKCVEEAAENDCGRLELSVLTWNNKAIEFYERLGARRLSEWHYYRMTRETIEKLRKTNRNQKRTSRRV